MLSILLALVAGVVVAMLLKLTFVSSWWGVILPGVIAFVGVGIWLLRRTSALVEPIMKQVTAHLRANPPRRDMAIQALRSGLSLGRWNPLLPAQLREQIGIFEYASGNLDAAEAELSQTSRFTSFSWQSRAYLGCVYFKKREPAKMKKAFEDAVRLGEKEGVLYTLYAHCVLTQGDKAGAVTVLESGLKKLPGDHRLEANLELAREGKKLKTAPYGDTWLHFGLEGPQPAVPTSLPKFMRGHAVRPGFRQRPQRK